MEMVEVTSVCGMSSMNCLLSRSQYKSDQLETTVVVVVVVVVGGRKMRVFGDV